MNLYNGKNFSNIDSHLAYLNSLEKSHLRFQIIINNHSQEKTLLILGNCYKDRCIREAVLNSNNGLSSENGRYLLMLHNKGELDVYCLTQKICSSNTANSNASKMHFQIDGNQFFIQKMEH